MREKDPEEVLLELAQRCDDWIESLAAEAWRTKRKFEHEMYVSRFEQPTSNWFRHSARIRFSRDDGRTLHMTWNRLVWMKFKDGRRVYRAVHIRKGKGMRYRATAFDPVSELERALIEETEEGFAQIRRDVQVIGRLRRTIAYALKAVAKESEREGSTQF